MDIYWCILTFHLWGSVPQIQIQELILWVQGVFNAQLVVSSAVARPGRGDQVDLGTSAYIVVHNLYKLADIV